jgi:membrane peptidoglycan carboxypeptidase
MAVVEQKSGFIRALIGGRDYGASNFNRILNMKRQVGSTFKPFVFLAAFEKGYAPNGTPWGAGTPIEDSPWKLIYDHGQQNWQPRNYEKSFMGWITFRQALAHSVNTATAKLASEVGLKNIIQTARNLGIQSPLPEVPSLSLGVAELNPLELLTAYATLANHGSKMKLTTVRAVTSADGTTLQRVLNFEEPAVDAGAADLVSSTLQSVFTEGTARGARSLGFDRPAAGKTGTTSNHRDAWFAGYTPQLTAVAWVGADQDGGGAPLALTGATSALPIWTQFMNQALSSEPLIPFSPSPKLTQVRLDARSGFLATLDCSERLTLSELTIVGKEPTEMKCSQDWPKSTQSTELRE